MVTPLVIIQQKHDENISYGGAPRHLAILFSHYLRSCVRKYDSTDTDNVEHTLGRNRLFYLDYNILKCLDFTKEDFFLLVLPGVHTKAEFIYIQYYTIQAGFIRTLSAQLKSIRFVISFDRYFRCLLWQLVLKNALG